MNLNNFSLIRDLAKNKHIFKFKNNNSNSNILPFSTRYEPKSIYKDNKSVIGALNNYDNNIIYNTNIKKQTNISKQTNRDISPNIVNKIKKIQPHFIKSTVPPILPTILANSINNKFNSTNIQSQRFYCGVWGGGNKNKKTNTDNSGDKEEKNNNNNTNDNKNDSSNKEENNETKQSKYSYKEGIFAFFQKLIEKAKYFLTRNKPLTSDQRIALISWAAFGTGALVLIGTTSFISFILFFANTFEFFEFLANKINKYLTNNTGITITFESARGDMKTGYIRLENVNVSRTPRPDDRLSSIQLSIRQVDIKLNLLWFLEGKGLIQECLVNGVRGLIDRRTEGIYFNKNMVYPRRKRTSGDFELEKLEVRDLLITMYLPDKSYRPLPISIYHLESDRFRKQWMLLDLISCKSIVGKFDNSLFTLTIPQHHRQFNIESDDLLSMKLKQLTSNGNQNLRNYDNYYNYITEPSDNLFLTQSNSQIDNDYYHHSHGLNNNNNNHYHRYNDRDENFDETKSMSKKKLTKKKRDEKLEYRELKIDGLNTDILSRNATGPLGWIKEGTFDIDLLILLPNYMGDNEKELLSTEQLEYGIIPTSTENPRMNLHLDFKVQLNHLYSVAPLYTPEISYISNALAHPIVAYINSHSKHIPLSFKFAMNVRQFNGSWTPSQACFWEMISASVYAELLKKVQETKNVTTLKKVASDLVNDIVQWIAPHLQALHYQQKEKEEQEKLLLLQQELKKKHKKNTLQNDDDEATVYDGNGEIILSDQIHQDIENEKLEQDYQKTNNESENEDEEEEEPINQQLVYYQEMQKLLDNQQQKQYY
ncbi:hypothetical protein RB653_008955 [Dictyostelium firmibasis]|uniref:Uncharacterized protein n=1 Tax=Dictyostelium firmibasis TaxID=79012 RepID=A0AAN7YPQ2_9MYCE